MAHPTIAREELAVRCASQGLAPMAIDLNRTHATNPLWPAHARFHVVWQTATAALLSVLAIGLIVFRGDYREQRFYLAAVTAGILALVSVVILYQQ